MNTENKLPVLRPEDKPAIPEPADTAAPAGGKASRWKRPETHEEKMLFWMRVTGICAILLAVLVSFLTGVSVPVFTWMVLEKSGTVVERIRGII